MPRVVALANADGHPPHTHKPQCNQPTQNKQTNQIYRSIHSSQHTQLLQTGNPIPEFDFQQDAFVSRKAFEMCARKVYVAGTTKSAPGMACEIPAGSSHNTDPDKIREEDMSCQQVRFCSFVCLFVCLFVFGRVFECEVVRVSLWCSNAGIKHARISKRQMLNSKVSHRDILAGLVKPNSSSTDGFCVNSKG